MREVYPSEIEDDAGKAFSRARREAFLRRAWARARHAPASVRLVSFDEAKASLGTARKIPLGVRLVPLRNIVGSVARGRDFDNRFLPLNRDLRARWSEIYRTLQRSEILGSRITPVSLYRIGSVYFVRDGNHRVSVARFRGWDVIEADVVLLGPPESRSPHCPRSL